MPAPRMSTVGGRSSCNGSMRRALTRDVIRRESQRQGLFLAFQRALQVEHVGPDSFQVGIELQSAAKALEGFGAIVGLQVALGHAGGRAEMVGIDFQRLDAVVNRLGEPAQAEQGQGPLVPGLGQRRGFGDQPGGFVDGFLKAPRTIELARPRPVSCAAGAFRPGTTIGAPQGGPLSPLLANVLLDEVDRELERRGHRFVRYADDCNVYVGSQRAGERVGRLLRKLYARLKLRVNEAKSAVAPATHRTLLGYSFWRGPAGTVKRRVAPKAMAAMKDRVREITRKTGGRSMERVIEELRGYLCGWREYFKLAETPGIFRGLDQWIRHRLRAIQLKQWKRGTTIYRELRALGMSEPVAARIAANARRWWKNSAMSLNAALPNRYFDGLGLPRLAT